MAVLVEGISVVVRVDAINDRLSGGWTQFLELVPNSTLCSDGTLVRVGFMVPHDAGRFVNELETRGLSFFDGRKAVDLVILDQTEGPTCDCDWIKYARLDYSLPGETIGACQMVGTDWSDVAVPQGWVYTSSLSNCFGFVSNEEVAGKLTFLRREGNLDVCMDTETGTLTYVGRTR
jgi:hypothetical protein